MLHATLDFFKKCPFCGGHKIKNMGGGWWWCMGCGEDWKE